MKLFAFDMLVVLCIFFAAEPSIYLAKCRREKDDGNDADSADAKPKTAIKVSYLFSVVSAVAAAIVYYGFNAEML